MTGCYCVVRHSGWNEAQGRASGDFLSVGGVDLGGFGDIVDAEYRRAAEDHPENPAFHMRPMFRTASPWGREIWALARQVRDGLPGQPPRCDRCAAKSQGCP